VKLEYITIVCDYCKIFSEDLPALPPDRELNFQLI